MVVNNTVNKKEGCARDRIKVCSVQSYVKEERGELNSAKFNPVVIEHGDSDITIKAGTHDIVRDKTGKVVERRPVSRVNAKRDEDLTH